MKGACAAAATLAISPSSSTSMRAVVEVVVADQAAEGLAAERAVFFFVQLLEDRALIPGRALVALEGLVQILLRDVHDPDLELLVGLGVVDQVVQPAPGAFELAGTRPWCMIWLICSLSLRSISAIIALMVLHDVARDELGAGQRLLRPGSCTACLDLALRARRSAA